MVSFQNNNPVNTSYPNQNSSPGKDKNVTKEIDKRIAEIDKIISEANRSVGKADDYHRLVEKAEQTGTTMPSGKGAIMSMARNLKQ